MGLLQGPTEGAFSCGRGTPVAWPRRVLMHFGWAGRRYIFKSTSCCLLEGLIVSSSLSSFTRFDPSHALISSEMHFRRTHFSSHLVHRTNLLIFGALGSSYTAYRLAFRICGLGLPHKGVRRSGKTSTTKMEVRMKL